MIKISRIFVAVSVLCLPSLLASQVVDPKLALVVPANPNPGGFVYDGTGVLSAEAKGRLNERITSVQQNIKGDIGVAIMADIKNYQPYEMATAIYRSWGIGTVAPIGNARRDVGVLILLVPKEKAPDNKGHCWIAPGIGAEGVLTDSRGGDICRDLVIPQMKERNYEAAVGRAIDGIVARFSRLDVLRPEDVAGILAAQGVIAIDSVSGGEDHDSWGFREWLFTIGFGCLVLFLGGVAVSKYERFKPRMCPKGHGKMGLVTEDDDDRFLEKSGQLEERLGSVNYDVWKCKLCPETIVIARDVWMSGHGDCPGCKCKTLYSQTRTITAATRYTMGSEEETDTCENCRYSSKRTRPTPMLPVPSSSSGGSGFGSSSGGGSLGGGSSFGGSGRSSGGGGGGSY